MKKRIQKRFKQQQRTKVAGALLDTIERKLEHTCNKFNCSRALVISIALAEFFGVSSREDSL